MAEMVVPQSWSNPAVKSVNFPNQKWRKARRYVRFGRWEFGGTDKHSYRGETVQYKGTRNEITLPFPIIQGHEVVLEIEEIDEEGSKI